MNTYRLTGNYGTFEIRKIIELPSHEDAYAQTGIVVDLIAAGWTILESPEGEEWTIEMLVDGLWVEADEDEEEDD